MSKTLCYLSYFTALKSVPARAAAVGAIVLKSVPAPAAAIGAANIAYCL